MKHLGVALIALGLMAADFLSERLKMASHSTWAFIDTAWLVLTAFWFIAHLFLAFDQRAQERAEGSPKALGNVQACTTVTRTPVSPPVGSGGQGRAR